MWEYAKSVDEVDEAFDEYFREVDKLVDSLVGKYGNKKMSTIQSGYELITTGRQLVEGAIMTNTGWEVAGIEDREY